MTGLERNADVVRMASYAPLFANLDAWQWTPNLIWTDNLRTLRTPSYHVQRLFAQNRGDRVVPVSLAGSGSRLYASASLDDARGEVIIKLVNGAPRESTATIELSGVHQLKPGTRTVLQADALVAVNDFASPERVSPRETALVPAGPKFEIALPASSFTIVRLGVGQ